MLGPRTRARYVRTGSEPQQCAVARIHPGHLRSLLGRLRVADLVDRAVPLHRLRGVPAEVAASPIESGTTVSAVARRLRSTLLERLGDHPGATVHQDLLDNARRALAGETGVAMLARDLCISERHLRTLFSDEMGLSPKHFAQILRVRRVAELAGGGDLAQVARQAGYYDQAHMTTEFRRVMGVPPGKYAVADPGAAGMR